MQTQNTNTKENGVVINKSTGHYTVYCDGKKTLCRLSTSLNKALNGDLTNYAGKSGSRGDRDKQINPVAIGDRVTFVIDSHGEGTIIHVADRRNYLARRSARPMPSAHAFEQMIAANLDQVVPIFAAADPKPKWQMLDRYLVMAESSALPATVVITKYDLVQNRPQEDELMDAVTRYQKIGYSVILTSAVEQQGLDEFRQAMAGRTSVLVGKSGVGKSTLLNQLQPGLGLRVQAVNATTGKGRHTTTHLEMFPLAGGGALIDTPGTREFGLWGLDPEDIASFFPEMRLMLGRCKFGLSCQHDEEPGCVIRSAVMEGAISPYRYKSYLRLMADL
jgi:ribosome biogenesis GTPase / thiamine phosphate phosphatase